jgi:hypothetical protein
MELTWIWNHIDAIGSVFTILSVIFGFFYKFYDKIDRKINKIEVKLDDAIKNQRDSMLQQSARTDKLYEMFIDLLKENKGIKNDKQTSK